MKRWNSRGLGRLSWYELSDNTYAEFRPNPVRPELSDLTWADYELPEDEHEAKATLGTELWGAAVQQHLEPAFTDYEAMRRGAKARVALQEEARAEKARQSRLRDEAATRKIREEWEAEHPPSPKSEIEILLDAGAKWRPLPNGGWTLY